MPRSSGGNVDTTWQQGFLNGAALAHKQTHGPRQIVLDWVKLDNVFLHQNFVGKGACSKKQI